MKRLCFFIGFGFFLASAFSGCLAGPGVEPPRINDEKGQQDAGVPTVSPDETNAGSETAGSAGSFVSGSGGATGGAGGAGGSAQSPMDAGVFSDGGISDTSVRRDGEDDDDAGSER
jgi:hypothetical protein